MKTAKLLEFKGVDKLKCVKCGKDSTEDKYMRKIVFEKTTIKAV